MKYRLIILFLFCCLYACSPKISMNLTSHREPLDEKEKVEVVQIETNLPENAIYLGTIKAGDTGFTTENDYNVVLRRLKDEARKAGANVLKITRYKQPDLWSSAQRIRAGLYYCDSLPVVNVQPQDTLMDWDYALLHFYRFSGVGAAIGYDIHLGDSVICRAKNKWNETIKVYVEGDQTLWAKTEARAELPLHIEKGREYYIRCGITMGVVVGHPSLTLMDKQVGKTECDALKKRKK